MRAILDNLESDDELNAPQSDKHRLKRRVIESDDEGNQDTIPADTPSNSMAPPLKRRKGPQASLLPIFVSHLLLCDV